MNSCCASSRWKRERSGGGRQSARVALDGVKRACRVPFMWPGLLDLFIVVCNLSAGVVDEIVERGDSD